MTPSSFGPVKRALAERTRAELESLAARAAACRSAGEVRQLVAAR
jgi:phosphoenolpyruvate-protein kinase (PTS system EI component)